MTPFDLLLSKGYIWAYGEHEDEPHAILTSGRHSDFFANITNALHDPMILKELFPSHKIFDIVPSLVKAEYIMCPGYGAVALASYLSIIKNVPWGYADKDPIIEYDKSNIPVIVNLIHNKRFNVEGKKVLVVEDVWTTGTSVKKTIAAIEDTGGEVLSPVFVVLDRDPYNTDGILYEVESLIEYEAKSYESDSCPLCTFGSKALRPKGNWDKFTKYYTKGQIER